MVQIPPPPVPTQLIVFADDWGRHPSSSQHLIRELLPQYPTLWVNTVGTRKPRLTMHDLKRGSSLVASWFVSRRGDDGSDWTEGLRVIAPKMYPGYRTTWQRKFNARRVAQAVNAALLPDHRHVVVTALPTTADLTKKIDVDRWVYYCVDDFSKWPGTDHAVMDVMERELVTCADAVVCVSQILQKRVESIGRRSSSLLTHGVDQYVWQNPLTITHLAPDWPEVDQPVALFWGLLDKRLDREWSVALRHCPKLLTVFAGPMQSDFTVYDFNAGMLCLGPIAYEDLPAHAAASSVLIMPYIDAPVTRAMQPLKLKEYLATMKPVVVRDLPSTRAWADCCDLASDSESFVRLVEERCKTGTPPGQIEARKRRLASESWTAKAAQLAEIINAD